MVKDFDELEVYKMAGELTRLVYSLTEEFPEKEKFNIVSQLRRAVASIGANIAEGYGRFHYKENVQFCRQARGSLAEVKHFLILSKELKYVPESKYLDFLEKYENLKIRLNNYIKSIGKRNI
ncbi:MAG: four helix bundle protein [Armatimonadetes bacterium CG07_land_8_20_14_0_80_40_9]|nr:MAG: four helix bundle protein [Armatimonadetes bacterium CG07_land_8_20_14_0_80_40_9]